MNGLGARGSAMERYSSIKTRHTPVDLLQDASADSFAAWLVAHPSVELISRGRGATFADGANRGAPQALQIADRGPGDPQFGRSTGESPGAASRRSETCVDSQREEHQVTAVLDQQALTHIMVRSQAEQQRQARRERRLATFTRVQENSRAGMEWGFDCSSAWYSQKDRREVCSS